jgi:hypothetical protein
LTIDFLLRRKKAAWDWTAVTANRAISLEDKTANPTLPWGAINCTSWKYPPPLQVVLDSPELQWPYKYLAGVYRPSELLALMHRPEWISDFVKEVSKRATMDDVLKNVSWIATFSLALNRGSLTTTSTGLCCRRTCRSKSSLLARNSRGSSAS